MKEKGVPMMTRVNRNTPDTVRRWDPFSELSQLQRAMNRAFESRLGERPAGYPAFNVSADEHEALLTAEVPGVEPGDLEITVQGNVVSLKGRRKEEEPAEGDQYHRRERPSGSFARSLELPYNLDPGNVSASLEHGVLRVVLPRAEADKPRKVRISS